jgi:hypothetical protein
MRFNAITLLRGSLPMANRAARVALPGVQRHLFVAPEGFQWVGAASVAPFVSSEKDPVKSFQARTDYIAGIYNQFLPGLCVDADAVLLFEDDIAPPAGGFDALRRLLEASGPDVAAVCAAYPQKGNPVECCLWEEGFSEGVFSAKLPPEPFPIYRGGTGFALFRAASLAACLPLRRDPEGFDWDPHLARQFKAKGWTWLAHGGVRCGHGDHPAP